MSYPPYLWHPLPSLPFPLIRSLLPSFPPLSFLSSPSPCLPITINFSSSLNSSSPFSSSPLLSLLTHSLSSHYSLPQALHLPSLSSLHCRFSPIPYLPFPITRKKGVNAKNNCKKRENKWKQKINPTTKCIARVNIYNEKKKNRAS